MERFKDIIKEYGAKTELHAHTSPVSKCSCITPQDMARVYGELGCDAVVITNHLNMNWTEGDPSQRAEEYLNDYYETKKLGDASGLSVILGAELCFDGSRNDYLVYGIEPSDIEKMIYYLDKGIEAFYRDFKSGKNLILQAHPFRKNMTLAPLDAIDGIETFNCHPAHNSKIGEAARYARNNGLLVSGGTDYHDSGDEGICLMRSRMAPRDSFDIVEILKSRDYLFDLSGSIVFPYGY